MTSHTPVTGYLTPEDMARAQFVGMRRTAINDITAQVSDLTGIAVKDLLGKSRLRRIAHARFLIWFIAHREGLSIRNIAKAFDRDHTTIHHGIQFEEARRAEVAA